MYTIYNGCTLEFASAAQSALSIMFKENHLVVERHGNDDYALILEDNITDQRDVRILAFISEAFEQGWRRGRSYERERYYDSI